MRHSVFRIVTGDIKGEWIILSIMDSALRGSLDEQNKLIVSASTAALLSLSLLVKILFSMASGAYFLVC